MGVVVAAYISRPGPENKDQISPEILSRSFIQSSITQVQVMASSLKNIVVVGASYVGRVSLHLAIEELSNKTLTEPPCRVLP